MDTTEQAPVSHFTVCKILKNHAAHCYATSKDGKTIFYAGDNGHAIWKVSVAEVEPNSASKPRLSKPELIFAAKGAGKAYLETPGVLTHEEGIASRIFVDFTTDQLIMTSQAAAYRFSTDLKSLEPLVYDPSQQGDAEVSFLRTNIRQTSSGRVVVVIHGTVHELIISDQKISFISLLKLSDVDINEKKPISFDIGPDGSMYYAWNYKIYQLLPGGTTWKHFTGSGREASRTDFESPLASSFGRNVKFAVDPSGNLILSSMFHDALRMSEFLRFYNKNGKKQIPLLRFADIRAANQGRIFSVKQIISSTHSERLYIASELEIIAIDPNIPREADERVLRLSALWSAHDQYSDLKISLPSGKLLNLHKCIILVRAPALLELLERSTPFQLPLGIIEQKFILLLSFIYDDILPEPLPDEEASSYWLDLHNTAESFKMDSLTEICKTMFRRALVQADADSCLDAVESVLHQKNEGLTKICHLVLLSRPPVLAEEARIRRFSAYPGFWVPLFAGYAGALDLNNTTAYNSYYLNMQNQHNIGPLELPPTLGRDLDRLLDSEIPPLPDMTINGIPCHLAIIASRCPFVRAAMSSGLREASERVITLSDPAISPIALRRIIRFLYVTEAKPEILTDDPEICEQLLSLVDFLQLDAFGNLIEYCEKVIRRDEEERPMPGKQKSRRHAPLAEESSPAEIAAQKDSKDIKEENTSGAAPPKLKRRKI